MVLNLNTAPDMLLGYAVDFVGVTGVPATCGNNEIFTMGIYYGTMDLLSQQLRPLSKGADAVASELVDGRARGLRARPRLLISISRAHLSSQPPTARFLSKRARAEAQGPALSLQGSEARGPERVTCTGIALRCQRRPYGGGGRQPWGLAGLAPRQPCAPSVARSHVPNIIGAYRCLAVRWPPPSVKDPARWGAC